MISAALDFIRSEIRDHLGLADSEISLGHLHTLNDSSNAGVRLALVNVTEESTLRNTPHSQRGPSGQVEYREPPLYLNVFLAVAFDFGNYQTDLIRLSETLELFQATRFFDQHSARAANPFPSTLQRLILDLYSADLEQLNQLWGIMGGSYFPSLIYQLRLLRIQGKDPIAGPRVTSLQVHTGVKTS